MARTAKKIRPKPLVLIMIEGLGVAPTGEANALSSAMPYFNHLVGHYPTGVLLATGPELGLPLETPGNSAIAHAIIGSGRAFPNAQFSLDQKIIDQSFFDSKQIKALKKLIQDKKTIHLIGLLSTSEKEASLEQVKDLIDWLVKEGATEIKLHGILDGREAEIKAGQKIIEELILFLKHYPVCEIVSLIGRLYALDDRANYKRTIKAFNLFTQGQGNVVSSLKNAFSEVYDKKIFDEEFPPTIISHNQEKVFSMSDNDLVIFWNYNKENIRQLVEQFLEQKPNLKLVSLTDYGYDERILALDNPNFSSVSLGKILSDNNLRQLRISDSAGFPNVTTMLDCFSSPFYEGLDKKLISSLPGDSFTDSILENIKAIKQASLEALEHLSYDFIAITLSQIDIVAHHNDRSDFSKVIAAIDEAVKSIVEAIENTKGLAVIVGTHGFAEKIIDPVDNVNILSHSDNPVPIYIIGHDFRGFNLGWPEALGRDLSSLKPLGNLTDVAPTILSLLHLPIPPDMTGHNLIN
jgi:2,3-bisphosphoglycerate-independent phosphoglycerate mutase